MVEERLAQLEDRALVIEARLAALTAAVHRVLDALAGQPEISGIPGAAPALNEP